MIAIALLATGIFLQQDVRFGGPLSGWVYDPPAKAIRPVNGMPGAALLGRPAVSDLEWASTASNGSALALAARKNGAPFLVRGDGAETPIEGLDLAESLPRLAIWTADATKAILIWPETNSIQAVDIESGRATTGAWAGARRQIGGLPEGAGAISQAAATTDELLFVIPKSGIFRVRLDDPQAGARLLLAVSDDAAIALDSSSRILWTADRGTATLFRVSLVSGESTSVATDATALGGVSAIGLPVSGREVILANSANRKVYRVDVSSWALTENPFGLDSAPGTMFAPLARPGVFVLGLRASAADPLYIWDESSGDVFFVPGGEAR